MGTVNSLQFLRRQGSPYLWSHQSGTLRTSSFSHTVGNCLTNLPSLLIEQSLQIHLCMSLNVYRVDTSSRLEVCT